MKLKALALSILTTLALTVGAFATVLHTAPVDEFRSVQGAVEFHPGYVPAYLPVALSDVPGHVSPTAACGPTEDGAPNTIDNAKEMLYSNGFTIKEMKLNALAADPDMDQMYGPLPIFMAVQNITLVFADPTVELDLITIITLGYGADGCYLGQLEFPAEVLRAGVTPGDQGDIPAKF